MVILPHRRKAFRAVPASEGGGGGDPYWNQVSLLLHCDGTNGSTTFVDSSNSAKTVTAVGNAQITTTDPKFDTGALLLDGNGDYVTTAAFTDFDLGTGDFTIEFFVKFNGAGRQYMLDYVQQNLSVIAITTNTGVVEVYTQASHAINSGATPFNLGQWYHISLSRSGGTWSIYRDGSLYVQATGQASRTFGSSSFGLVIGASGAGAVPANATFDEVRITKGVARYTSNFTPPTQAFADS